MRTLLAVMAASLLGVANPASAEPVQLSISGTLQGTRNTIMCAPGSASTCFSSYSGGLLKESYSSTFTQALMPFDLKQGDNSFSYGAVGSGGLFTGTINYDNGVLTGRNLFYSFETGGVRSGALGGSFINASAPSFSVAAITAVPEPATWALMLVGFLAVGSALRQAPRRRALLPA